MKMKILLTFNFIVVIFDSSVRCELIKPWWFPLLLYHLQVGPVKGFHNLEYSTLLHFTIAVFTMFARLFKFDILHRCSYL